MDTRVLAEELVCLLGFYGISAYVGYLMVNAYVGYLMVNAILFVLVVLLLRGRVWGSIRVHLL